MNTLFDETHEPESPVTPSRHAARKPDCCPYCGAAMREYSHRLNRGLVTVLRRLEEAGGVAKLADLDLTHEQASNAQKLQYFGLMQKHLRDGRHVAGTWKITELGRRFLAGDAEVYAVAVTYRGEIVRHEGKLVGIEEVEGVTEYRQRRDYAADATPHRTA